MWSHHRPELSCNKNPENDQVDPKQNNPPGTIHDGTKPGKCAPKAKSKTLCTQPCMSEANDSMIVGLGFSVVENGKVNVLDRTVYCAFMFKIFWEFCGCGLIIDRNYLA
jgi:hypothetical protein